MPTVVKYSAKLVKNLGNYESIHVDVGVEDSPRELKDGSVETSQQTLNRLKAFVEQSLLESVSEYVKDLKN